MSEMSPNDWLEAVVHSASEFAVSMLGIGSVEVIEPVPEIPEHSSAAVISLVGENTAVEIGLSLEADACQNLVRGMLGMGSDEGDLPDDEVADALSEIANIIAGQVKSFVSGRVAGVNIGLPIFIRGDYSAKAEAKVTAVAARIGDIPVTLVVITHGK